MINLETSDLQNISEDVLTLALVSSVYKQGKWKARK